MSCTIFKHKRRKAQTAKTDRLDACLNEEQKLLLKRTRTRTLTDFVLHSAHVPATLLGRLAVSSEYNGQKLGTLLLMDALHRAWRNTSEVGSAGVVAEAIDDSARTLYLHHEFISLPEHPHKLFLAMATIQRAFYISF